MNALSIVGVSAVFSLLVLSVLCLCAEKGFHPLRGRVREFRRLPLFEKLLVLAFVGVLVAYASVKEPANSPPSGLMGPRMALMAPDALEGTGGLPTNGWREVSRSANAWPASAFARPADGQVWEQARARGARRGYWRLPFGGWSFPGSGFGWTNGFLWAEGQFRPKVESTRDGVVLFDRHLALAPFANWERYGLDASLCWSRTNAVGGIVGTVVGAAVDDDPAKAVSAQIELFPADGRLVLRYDLSRAGEGPFRVGPFENGVDYRTAISSNVGEVVFQRVHPDDWDMDGLPNGMDEDPRIANANAGWNQSTEWAIRAFPSHAAEIAAEGYSAFAASRGSQSNRHLVGLHVDSPTGAWPVCLTFGGRQVMCDGREEVVFAIDDGARYPFSLSAGELAVVTLHASNSIDESCFAYGYPYEFRAGDVVVHLDSPRSGWMGRLPEVQVDTSGLTHFFPDDTRYVSAVLTNCHEDAYIGCEWHGGGGIAFSDGHSLSTAVTWNGDVAWATNSVALVTMYEGDYAVTNTMLFSVGSQSEPSVGFSISCQEVFFLNDADLDNNAYSPTNRPERIRPVTVSLIGATGMKGNVSFSTEWTPDDSYAGGEGCVLFQVVDGVTNRLFDVSSVPLEIRHGNTGHSDANTVYMSCPQSGAGRLIATLTLTNGCVMSASTPYRVIEPIRKLVTIEKHDTCRINPSRLVYGTNTVLHVDFYGMNYSPEEIMWKIVSGPAEFVSSNGCCAVVRSITDEGEVVVEARFNDDEIQPTFVLPIVRPRVVPIRAFVVDPPDEDRSESWQDCEIMQNIELANDVFQQVGIVFELQGDIIHGLSNELWTIRRRDQYTNSMGVVYSRLSPEARILLDYYQSSVGYVTNDCVEVYFTGVLAKDTALAFCSNFGIVMGRDYRSLTLAHELGHSLGLNDCYSWCRRNVVGELSYDASLPGSVLPVDINYFCSCDRDWGKESGRGFYARSDTRKAIMNYFLMNGYSTSTGMDIPDGRVLSLRGYGEFGGEVKESKIGAGHFKRTNKEVYTR